MRRGIGNISKEDWDILEKTGLLWELYPSAPSTWYELGKNNVYKVAHKKNASVVRNTKMRSKELQKTCRA